MEKIMHEDGKWWIKPKMWWAGDKWCEPRLKLWYVTPEPYHPSIRFQHAIVTSPTAENAVNVVNAGDEYIYDGGKGMVCHRNNREWTLKATYLGTMERHAWCGWTITSLIKDGPTS